MPGLYVVLFGLLIAIVDFNVASTVELNDTLVKVLQALEGLTKQMKSLEVVMEQRMPSLCTSPSIKDVKDSILADNFQLAEQQIIQFADNNRIVDIVHNVYANSPVSVEILVNFANALTDSGIKFRVFAALHDEIRLSGHSYPFELIAIAQAMEAEQQKTSSHIKALVQGEIDSVVDSVKDSAVSILKAAILGNGYRNNTEIEALATAILNLGTDVSDHVMQEVVDCVFRDVPTKDLLDSISRYKHTPQVISGLTAIFNKFLLADDLNNNAILDLASHVRRLQQRNEYKSMDPALQRKVQRVIERFPTCAKNLYFYSNVCFWNKDKNVYMYAASAANSYDMQRRSIFTWYSGNTVNGSVWRVERIGEYYFFKSAYYVDEYLYSMRVNPYSKDMRYVFTWIPGKNTDQQSRWLIELDGDYCYVKSAFNNEYLFASSVNYDRVNSYVFTWINPVVERSDEFRWQIQNCDQSGKR